jgi:hypothetical protein
VPRQSHELEPHAHPVRHCEEFRVPMPIGIAESPRQSSEWDVIGGFNQEVVALTTDSGSNFFSGDCHIAGSSFIA